MNRLPRVVMRVAIGELGGVDQAVEQGRDLGPAPGSVRSPLSREKERRHKAHGEADARSVEVPAQWRARRARSRAE